MNFKHIFLAGLVLFSPLFFSNSIAQGSLLDLLDEEEDDMPLYTTASFKTNRVINLHSLENTHYGVLDAKISHRFGSIKGGGNTFFGLDNATVRLGLDYGLLENLQIGIGRSSLLREVDAYAKYRLLRQREEQGEMPITLTLFAAAAIRTGTWELDGESYPWQSRLNYTYQLIVGRKFSDFFTLQLSPTLVHRNLVPNEDIAHDVLAVGAGARFRLSRRVTLNLEYIYVFPDQLESHFKNSASIGLDIETGGHVFQLHFTNSAPIADHAYITRTRGDWSRGDIHFGFNIARVFTIVKPDMSGF